MIYTGLSFEVATNHKGDVWTPPLFPYFLYLMLRRANRMNFGWSAVVGAVANLLRFWVPYRSAQWLSGCVALVESIIYAEARLRKFWTHG